MNSREKPPLIPFPPSALSTTPETINGITYTASVSSLFSGNAVQVYNKNVADGFTSQSAYDTTTGEYTGSNTTAGIGGEFTTLQLSTPIVVQKYDLSVMTIHFTTRAPSTVYLFGSTDGTTWTQLHTVSDLTWAENTKTFTFTNSIAYSYYQLVVNRIVPNNQGRMLIADITYYA